MTIQSSSRIGSYEILSPLGAGGMGEVWRAHDARINASLSVAGMAALISLGNTTNSRSSSMHLILESPVGRRERRSELKVTTS